MNADIISVIDEKYSSFSKGQKLIAKYIKENYDKAAFMTASKLGKTVGVSESTVVRFATELGFDGYPGFQKAFSDLIRTKLTSVQRVAATTERMGDDILGRVLSRDIDMIKKTVEMISSEDFKKAVEKIISAKRVYIIGIRSAASLANFLNFYLNMICDNVHFVNTTSAAEMFERILRINENDVLIAISFPRYSKRTVKASQYAKESGANVVAITDSHSSPLAEFSDELLVAKSDTSSFVDSLVAPMSVINALIVAIGLQKKDEISSTFEKLERIWDEYEIYAKSEEAK
jgi:DNA-binding MurR/RpiR family transcriptional regulator